MVINVSHGVCHYEWLQASIINNDVISRKISLPGLEGPSLVLLILWCLVTCAYSGLLYISVFLAVSYDSMDQHKLIVSLYSASDTSCQHNTARIFCWVQFAALHHAVELLLLLGAAINRYLLHSAANQLHLPRWYAVSEWRGKWTDKRTATQPDCFINPALHTMRAVSKIM